MLLRTKAYVTIQFVPVLLRGCLPIRKPSQVTLISLLQAIIVSNDPNLHPVGSPWIAGERTMLTE